MVVVIFGKSGYVFGRVTECDGTTLSFGRESGLLGECGRFRFVSFRFRWLCFSLPFEEFVTTLVGMCHSF